MQLSKDFREFLELLTANHVRYIVVGGYAVASYTVPRYTKDLDVWIEPTPDNARNMVAALEAFGFGSLGLTVDDFSVPDQVVQLGYEPNRIDILTSISGVRFDEAYPQRVITRLDGVDVPIIDRRSLAANKRATGRPRDLLDAEDLEK